MEFRILGPMEVTDREHVLALGGLKQRLLLAVLLLRRNEVVSPDQLRAELWGERPPATAAKSIQVYVSRLRKELGPDKLVTRAPGYVLRVEDSELDAAQFDRLLAEARTADPTRAADQLRTALALWRGPALADLAYEAGVQADIQRLDELRLTALEERIDADLAAGRHGRLIGSWRRWSSKHPLRERLRGQLMLALYRSSRHAEALNVYRSAHASCRTSSGSSQAASCGGSSRRSCARTRRSTRRRSSRRAASGGTPRRAGPSDPGRPARPTGYGRAARPRGAAGRGRAPARTDRRLRRRA